MPVPANLLSKALTRVRISEPSSPFASDVEALAEFALEDLKRIGVPEADLEEPDALLTQAVLVYVQANFGQSVDEKLMKSYDMILTKIKGSRHCIFGERHE